MDPVQLGLMMVLNLAIGLYAAGGHDAVHHQLDREGQGRRDGARYGPFYLVAFAVLALISLRPAFVLR